MEIFENEHEENLSPYQRWELEKFGSITGNCDPNDEPAQDRLTTQEETYIYNSQNEPL